MSKTAYYISVLLITFITSCKDPFEIETGFGRSGFLVVEGYINIGEGITTIKLSRTTPIDALVKQSHETGAALSIEDGQFTYPLTEIVNGIYVSDELDLPLDRNYRLRIVTSDEKAYLSEYSTPVRTPPIDSVTWRQDFDGVKIYANTHDPLNQTQYYQWEYEEVWELESPYTSYVKYDNGEFSHRPNQEIKDMLKCWKYTSSPPLNIGSSNKLSSDVITLHPIVSIPANSEQISIRYSALVKQHALNESTYEFFQILLKNNESLGTFSDPQPSQLTTNIHCLNAEEIVVGFIGSYTTETKRIFINRSDVLGWRYSASCEERTFVFGIDDIGLHMRYHTPTRYQTMLIDGQPVQTGVFATTKECADCRIGGGTNLIPSFWDITEE